jgi:hypothetical protein
MFASRLLAPCFLNKRVSVGEKSPFHSSTRIVSVMADCDTPKRLSEGIGVTVEISPSHSLMVLAGQG